jgi:hypothetical protein
LNKRMIERMNEMKWKKVLHWKELKHVGFGIQGKQTGL